MSTQFPVYKDSGLEIELDEHSCKFYIDIEVHPDRCDINDNGSLSRSSEKKLSESEIIDVAVRLLGPLFYYNPGEDILKEFTKRLKERGYL